MAQTNTKATAKNIVTIQTSEESKVTLTKAATSTTTITPKKVVGAPVVKRIIDASKVDTKKIMELIAAPNDDEVVSVVRTTKDYTKFKPNKYNRNIDETYMKHLERSFKTNGNLGCPVIVDNKYRILDGHHLFEYLKRNNLPVTYVIVHGMPDDFTETENTQYICAINNTRHNWKLMNYIDSFAKQEEELKEGKFTNYVLLKDIIKKYNFMNPSALIQSCTIGQISCASIYRGGKNLNCADNKMSISNGTFEFKDYKKTVEQLEWLTKTFEMFKDENKRIYGASSNGKIARLIMYMCDQPEVSKTLLVKSINKYWKKKLTVSSGDAMIDILDKLCEIYNTNRSKNKIFLHDRFLAVYSRK